MGVRTPRERRGEEYDNDGDAEGREAVERKGWSTMAEIRRAGFEEEVGM